MNPPTAAACTLGLELLLWYVARSCDVAKIAVQTALFAIGCVAPRYVGRDVATAEMLVADYDPGTSAYLGLYSGHLCFLWLEFYAFERTSQSAPHPRSGPPSANTRPSRALMLGHHLVTTILVVLAHRLPATVAGAYIVWLLSPSEAMLCLKRVLETPRRRLVCDGAFLLSWVWGRVLQFTVLVLVAWTAHLDGTPLMSPRTHLFATVVLTVEYLMQVWWSVEIARRVRERYRRAA